MAMKWKLNIYSREHEEKYRKNKKIIRNMKYEYDITCI